MVELSSNVGYQMTKNEARSLLEYQGHGTLCLGADNRGYGIPISYAYEPDGDQIVLEFINAQESKKQQFAERTDEVTLTVYNYESTDRWESVVVTGTLQQLSEDEVANRFASLFFDQADDAAGDLRWIDWDALERQWYALQVSTLTGRHSGVILHEESSE